MTLECYPVNVEIRVVKARGSKTQLAITANEDIKINKDDKPKKEYQNKIKFRQPQT